MLRIVTGGQTGVDRGALDAALERGLPCGGWCPAGRRAEDGPIPARYPLRELAGAGYKERTRRNVEDSDGTLVVAFGPLAGGTALTERHARALGRPLLRIDAERMAAEEAAEEAFRFLRRHGLRTLNVAGPRASEAPQAHGWARALVRRLADVSTAKV